MVSGGMTCIKYLLFAFNLLFAISGVAILTVGAIIQHSYYHYSAFVDSSYSSAPLVLIVVGAIIFVVAFFGCCGAIRENHCMIITFSVFLLIIFTLELAAGIAGYVKRNEIGDMLEKNMNQSMIDYPKQSDIEKTWDIVQNDLQCCGMKGPSDWKPILNDTLPNTCCANYTKDQKCTIDDPNLYKLGCKDELKDLLENKTYIIGAVGIGVAIVQLVGVVFACCLARSIRKEYETV